ncbi:MAG: hypothetical protein QOH35_2314 [Acidobacteriaceae bacterium]|jgi:hypothetical protein|nr:hypothetical protein [Acidobacteriaceae bacterium]MDX6458779.1 hypothetical protein [Acidobacteriaceae bacterium]MEA2540948.1 hypothetical protein [Acidobacteriaceae bacterium]MEA3006587.1 hypothetical protein [Acidobacteriaceae bacterium]
MIDTNRRLEPLGDRKVYLLVKLTILRRVSRGGCAVKNVLED